MSLGRCPGGRAVVTDLNREDTGAERSQHGVPGAQKRVEEGSRCWGDGYNKSECRMPR
jgi:hypothetical protein